MRGADNIHIKPQRRRRRPVCVAHDLDQVRLEEVFPVQDVRVCEMEVLRPRGRGTAFAAALPWYEGFGGDVVA